MKAAKSKRLLTIIIVVVLVAAIGSASLLTGAIWNEEEAVHIRSEDIESSTLIIGTHLIHLSALTQEIYDIAQDSAGESGQSGMYYKSELAEGTWFDISTANSLLDITSEGSPVSDSVVEALFMTHHTKSDGVTYDLRTNSPVNIFDLKDPYDFDSMEEMMPLKNQWKIITDSKGDTDVSDRIKELLQADLQDAYTMSRDLELSSIQSYLDVLNNNDGGSSEIEAVQMVMASVDAQRRYHVLDLMNTLLDDYMTELSAAAEESSDEDEGDEGDQPSSDESPTTIMSLVAECIQNVQDSAIEYQGKILAEDDTVYQYFRVKFANDLITHAKSNDHASCDTDVSNLICLDNILNDVISRRSDELALLSPTVLQECTTRYTARLSAGQTAEYAAEVANRSAQVLLNSIISASTSQTNSKRNELEFMISAYCSRVDAQAGIDFIEERITLTKTFYTMPPFDAFSDAASGTIDEHMDFLTKKKSELQKALGGSELDKLRSEKSDLQQKLRSALDKNDLAGAKSLEDQIAAIDDKIAALENQASQELNGLLQNVSDLEKQLSDAENAGNTDLANKLRGDLANAKADLSNAQAGLSDGSLANEIAALRKDGLDILGQDGSLSGSDLDRLQNDVDALEGLLELAPELAFPALKDLHNGMSKKGILDGTNDFDDMMAQIENAILNAKDSYDSAMQDDKSADDLQAIVDAFLSGEGEGGGDLLDAGFEGGGNDGSRGEGEGGPQISLPSLDRDALLDKYGNDIFVMALQEYCDETGSDEALNLMVSVAQQQRNLGSLTIYNRINSTTGEFLPISAIGYYANLRYVEKKSGTGTLAQGAEYYGFSVYSDAVTRGRDAKDVDYMPAAAGYLGGIHITEDYSYDTFGVDCVYLSGCSFAVIHTDQLQALVDELFALFLA